jgi:hypothetical protein
MSKPPDKKKSARRFEQLNAIVDDIAPKLPSVSHVAVLLCCFRHGRGLGFFRVSTQRIAKATNLQRRRVQYILDDLERLGAVVLVSEHQGPIPRTYRIPFTSVNGALHCTIRNT